MFKCLGEHVLIPCSYEGTSMTPTWHINGSSYNLNRVPGCYQIIVSDNGITLKTVITSGSLNSTTYQCEVSDVFSNVGTLHICKLTCCAITYIMYIRLITFM